MINPAWEQIKVHFTTVSNKGKIFIVKHNIIFEFLVTEYTDESRWIIKSSTENSRFSNSNYLELKKKNYKDLLTVILMLNLFAKSSIDIGRLTNFSYDSVILTQILSLM